MRWQIEMLGCLVLRTRNDPHFAAAEAAIPTRFYSQKAALLLARLAFPPLRAHGREEIIETLWPGSEPAAGRANLRNVLSALRRQLEPDPACRGQVLFADNTQIALHHAAVTTDVAAFEAALKRARRAGGEEEYEAALREALHLYRGDLLPGVYADWVVLERELLACAHADALRALQALSEKQGDAAAAAEARSAAFPARAAPLRSRFFGRDRELREVSALLRADRLVTLTGVGGVGKTRLAREVAFGFAGPGATTAVFVPLDAARRASQIAEKILMALGVPLGIPLSPGEEGVQAAAVAALQKAGVLLLVLDNLEHLLTPEREVQAVVAALRAACPTLCLLLTSQRALEMEGETVFVVLPLAFPTAAGGRLPLDALLQIPSVQLFADRAQAVRSDFAVTARNAAAVAAVCRQLEGIPLSLEIAGARSLVTTPWQIQAELEHRLGFLTRRPAQEKGLASPRHRSLRSTLEWSHSLLPPNLARFFARLSVFRGGLTAELAASVCDEADTLGSIEELCQASLLCAEESGETMRFRFLDTVRELAREKLTESGEEIAVRERHLTAFLALAETAHEVLLGPDQERWLHCLERDHDNLRAALAYAVSQPERTRALRLCCALSRFWQTRGYLHEGSDWLRTALHETAPPNEERQLWGRAINSLGSLLINTHRFEEAETALRTAFDLFCEISDPLRFMPMNNLGLIYLYTGKQDAARQAFTQCLEILGPNGDPRFVSSFLNNRGMAFLHLGLSDAAERDLEAALALYEQVGNIRGKAKALSNLGTLLIARKEYVLAKTRLSESLQLHESLGDPEASALCWEGLAGCALAGGDAREGAVLFGKAAAIRTQINAAVRPVDAAHYQKLHDNLRAALGQDTFERILREQAESRP